MSGVGLGALVRGLLSVHRGSAGAEGLAGRLPFGSGRDEADEALAFAGEHVSDCVWSCPSSCLRLSAEFGASPDPEGVSFDEFEADGLHFVSASPLACPAGPKMEGRSCSVVTTFGCRLALGGTPGPILLLHAASVKI